MKEYNDLPQWSEWDKGFLQGILLGEGGFCIARVFRPKRKSFRKEGYRCFIDVVNTDKTMIDRVMYLCGNHGSYRAYTYQKGDKIKPIYRFRIEGKQLIHKIFTECKPWYGKNKQVNIILQFLDLISLTKVIKRTKEMINKQRELYWKLRKIHDKRMKIT